MKFLDLYNQDKRILNSIKKDFNQIIKKSDFILGKKVFEFEEKFAKYCNTKFSVSCANGTDSIYLAIKSLNLPENSEVIVPAMTYCSTIFSVLRAGCKPVLVDIDYNRSVVSAKEIKKKLTNRTKLILLVHLYGDMPNLYEINKILLKKKIYIIEDASQAHGAFDYSTKKPIKAGSYGVLSCFSLYPGKNLGAYGDAGIITTNDKNKSKYISKFRNIGSDKKFFHDYVGVNSRLDTIQAAILIRKLQELDKFNNRRKEIAKIYNDNINNKFIEKLYYSKGCVFHQYVIKVRKINKFLIFLKNNKIPFGRHYPFPLHKLGAVKSLFKKEKYVNSENLAKHGVSLPVNPLLKDREIKKICNILNRFS